MSSEIRLIHLADLHLGFTGPATLVYLEDDRHTGRYVRDMDIEEATRRVARHIRSLDPPADIVVIAGDIFHRATPLPRAIYLAAWLVHTVVQRGTEVVVVDGNHDQSAGRLHAGSPLDFLRELGARVVNRQNYEIIGAGEQDWRIARLNGLLAVHAVPYEAVQQGEFAGVNPLPGRINVLVAHGRIGGSPDLPEMNTLGLRAAEIPSEVLRRGWDYVALGDWHVHTTKPLADVPAYYAGSLEALTFAEAADFPHRKDDPKRVGGALDVRLASGRPAELTSLFNGDRRPVYRLKPIDATDLDVRGLMDQLRSRLSADLPPEALVLLSVEHCHRFLFEGVDQAELARLRSRVRRCEITWDLIEPEGVRPEVEATPIEEQWADFLAKNVSDEAERAVLVDLGRKRIETARDEVQRKRVAIGAADVE